jgi:hypothetical protein
LTNNRSAAAIGALFAGQKGYAQGLASGVGPGVAADGSNIAPQALALLNLKLPNGQYVIPTPQLIQPNQTFANQGLSSVSEPCTFHENQYMANADYYVSPANKLTFRFFSSTSDQDLTFPGQKMAGSGVSGWDVLQPVNFYHASINDTATISPRLVNQLVLGYHRQSGGYWQQQPFKDLYSQIGANAPAYDEVNPVIAIVGSIGMGGNGQDMKLIGDSFVAQDSLFYTLGRHSLRFGGLVDHNRTALGSYYAYGGVEFQTWADFLLGLNAQQLGTAAAGVLTGSIYQTTELQGDLDRDWRIWTADAYAQDDFKVTPRLTVNLGVRFEHVGDPGDALGHAGNFFLANANPNPPATGTIQGYVVASNFVGTIPAGVTQLGSTTGWLGNHTNTWNPRVGFAWQLPHSDRFVLRGGAGVYHSQLTTQSIFNTTTEPPYAESVSLAGSSAGNATWAQPFPAAVQFPQFPPYSPTTSLSFSAMSPDLRPPNTYRFSMGLQARLPAAAVLEVTYIGARDLHLLEVPRVDQANLASPSDPIRGLTTNTVANVAQRVPYEGFAPASFSVENTDASAWYNALQATLSKSLSHGLQFQASYTWARFLGDAYGIYSGQANFSAVYGDQDNAKQRYGPDNYIRDQRFVLSAMYSLPGPKDLASLKGELLGGWKLATVTTVQSGQHMTPFYSNASNVYGITTDRAQLVVGCTGANLVTPGSVGTKLTNYFNKSCFTTPPVVGADGKALNFGNAGMGILAGPGQFNSDLSMSKEFPVRLFKENSHFEFRAEFFNVFNHANFSTPGTSYGSSSFGVITGTTAGPRVGQLALKLLF